MSDLEDDVDDVDAKDNKKKKKTELGRLDNIDALKNQINKAFGAGAIVHGRGTIINVDTFPVGVAAIDKALGCGGMPQGRIVEFFGNESSGKTTTCLQMIASCQKHYFENKKRYGVAAFVDAEHAFDPQWATKCGVDVDALLFSQPNSGEEGLDIVKHLVSSGLIDLVIVDSVANLVPMCELTAEIGDQQIGAQARMMSRGMRVMTGSCSATKTTVIFINQVRNKVGLIFGSPEVTPGGKALKFYASIRMEILKGKPIKSGDDVIGFRPRIKIIKNKCAPPFTSAEFDICVGDKRRPICGLDSVASLFEVGSSIKLITKKGNFSNYGDVVLGNGNSASIEFLRNSPTLLDDLKKKIYDSLGKASASIVLDDTPSDDTDIDVDDLDDSILSGTFTDEQ